MSDEENQNLFGKCNNLNGHGHNYVLEVSVRGPVDRKTGMVMNLTELKDIIAECVMNPLDHKNIDKDVAYFKNIPSTAENIAVFIWDAVSDKLNKPDMLCKVKLWETDKNFVVYQGAKFGVQRPLIRKMSENVCGHMSSDSE